MGNGREAREGDSNVVERGSVWVILANGTVQLSTQVEKILAQATGKSSAFSTSRVSQMTCNWSTVGALQLCPCPDLAPIADFAHLYLACSFGATWRLCIRRYTTIGNNQPPLIWGGGGVFGLCDYGDLELGWLIKLNWFKLTLIF